MAIGFADASLELEPSKDDPDTEGRVDALHVEIDLWGADQLSEVLHSIGRTLWIGLSRSIRKSRAEET